jgi:hypothetical protein
MISKIWDLYNQKFLIKNKKRRKDMLIIQLNSYKIICSKCTKQGKEWNSKKYNMQKRFKDSKNKEDKTELTTSIINWNQEDLVLETINKNKTNKISKTKI